MSWSNLLSLVCHDVLAAVARPMSTSARPLMEIQRESLILGNNMSSGVTVPIFGKKFAKMRQREQLEV